jgi:hypothetical protein
MSEQIQERIIKNLIQSAPISLKADRPIRHHEDGPAFAIYQVACMTCQQQMKANWIQVRFVQGAEEKWESEAQARVDQHLKQFHEAK